MNFIVNFEHVLSIFPVFLLLTQSMYLFAGLGFDLQISYIFRDTLGILQMCIITIEHIWFG